jgi:hypothetical protein
VEEAAKVGSEETTKATSGNSAPRAPSAGAVVSMGAADNTVLAAGDQASTSETPPTRNFLMFLEPQPNPEAPSSSGAGVLEAMEDEVVIPMSRSTEDVRTDNDDVEDLAFLQTMADSFKAIHHGNGRRKVQRED